MTEPSGFEYRDDSVVARISVDVPAATLTDLDQVRERTAALRTELESIARASGDWVSYMQQIPQISEQANQSYRNMITSLERMSYIQQELGGQANVGMSGAPMGNQGSAGQPYSTAAPAGYMDPFMGMPGTGMGMGMQGAQSYMQSMMMNDPRMFANMAAQRGYPINPAQLGLVGGAVAAQQGAAPHTGGGMGQGAPPPGSMSPQATSSARDSSAQPNPSQGGVPSSSEPQRDPATPHPDTPAWQRTLSTIAGTAGSVLNETRAGMSGRGGGLIAGGVGALSAIGRIGGAGGGGGGGGDDGGGGGGGGDAGGGSGGGGNWGRVAAGAGIAAAGVGLGLKGLNKIQDAGEQIQQYRNLGAESGGGAVEGAGFEIQARMMSMNPFITLDQSRSIMQSALKNGYTGKEFDTVTGFMADNLKQMNMSSSESMQLFQSIVEKGHGSVEDLAKSMDQLKDYTRVDGNRMGQTQRNQQFEALTSQLADQGISGDVNTKMSNSINEAFSDNQILKGAVPQATMGGLQDPGFLMMMAQANGIQGVGDPEEVLARMEEQGIDGGQATENTYKRIAQMAMDSSGGDLTRGGVIFHRLLGQMGVQMTLGQARELFKQMVGGNAGAFTKGADQKSAEASADLGTVGEQADNLLLSGFKAAGNTVVGGVKTMLGIGGQNDSFSAAGRNVTAFSDQFSKYFNSSQDVATDASAATADREVRGDGPGKTQIGPGSGYQAPGSEGRVTGDLRITVDQNGKVSAPQTVSITGNQRQVNSGFGSGTMNNPGPGDMHQGTGWSN